MTAIGQDQLLLERVFGDELPVVRELQGARGFVVKLEDGLKPNVQQLFIDAVGDVFAGRNGQGIVRMMERIGVVEVNATADAMMEIAKIENNLRPVVKSIKLNGQMSVPGLTTAPV